MNSLNMLCAAQHEVVWLRRQNNICRRSLQNVDEMPDLLFVKHFGLNKVSFKMLCSLLRSKSPLKGTGQIPLELKVLCTLSFLATGSYQSIAGVTQHLSQRTTSRCIMQVVDALNDDRILGRWIVFPQTQQERSRIRQEFQRRFQLPGVVGCIDCTHIAIVRPLDNQHHYCNRKGYHSLNVQMICDSDLIITNVNAQYGGATHNQFVLLSSQVQSYMCRLHDNGEQAWLLGDAGYPLKPWLMPPLLDVAPGSKAETYTKRHSQARNCIKECIGLLKSRWRCLLRHRKLHYHPLTVSKIVKACCVLHNIAIKANLPAPPTLTPEEEDNDVAEFTDPSTSSQEELIAGREILDIIINDM